MRWSLLGVTGELVSLDQPPFVMAELPEVFGVGPVSQGTKSAPALSAGGRRSSSRLLERPVVLKVHILADPDPAVANGLWGHIEKLGRLLDPARGDCVLVAERDDGERREIVFHYTAGLNPLVRGLMSREVTVELVGRCPDPFWHSTEPTAQTLALPVTGSGVTYTPRSSALVDRSALIPRDGWEPTATGGVVVVDIFNSGSAAAWPDWSFHGSLTGVTATNLTSGRVWSWSITAHSTLTNVQTVDVVTHELSRAVRVGGVDKWRGLDPARQDLWPLEVGVNRVLIEVTGADASALGTVTWRPRWSTC